MTDGDSPRGCTRSIPVWPVHLVFPHLLPDETLYSLITRIYRLNEDANEREFCARLLGDPEGLRVADAEVDLPWLEKATHGFYGNVESLLAHATTAPFYQRLGTEPDIEAPKHPSPGGKSFSKPVGLATLSNGQPNIWKACPSCVMHDRTNHGVAYWHRTHQLPGVAVCLKHEEPLFALNVPYRERQGDFMLPDAVIEQIDAKRTTLTASSFELASRIAAMAADALQDNSPCHSPEVMQGALIEGLATRGLLTRGGRVNKRAFVDGFKASYTPFDGVGEFGVFLAERGLLRLAGLLGTSSLALPATLTLMLSFWLFGTWGLFMEHCAWRRTIAAASPLLLAEVTARVPERSRKEHHQTCLEFIASAPSASRTDFWKTHPKACRWLAQYDSDWLESRLPIAKKYAPRQLQLF